METIIKSVFETLEKNGYPEKRVTLPFKALFQACKRKDVTMAALLKELENQAVCHEMRDDRVLFFIKGYQPKEKPAPERPDGIPEDLYNEAMDKLKDMDPSEVERIKQQVMSMSPEEQQELMRHAKNMFGKNNS